LIGAVQIAKNLIVRDAAGSADFSADVFRRAMAVTEIEVRRDCRVAVMSKTTCAFPVPFIPSRRMMNNDHAWKWAGTYRMGVISIDQVAVMTANTDGLGCHAFVLVGSIHRMTPP